jgi:DNA-binding beta-propeller fold protein YncE
VADFNLDGHSDLVVANEYTNTVSIFAGNGDGTFSLAATCRVGRRPYAVAVGDFDRDGQPDIVTANYDDSTVSVLLNRTFPLLRISKQGEQIRLAWPASVTGFVVEASSALPQTDSWTAVTNNTTVVGDENVATNLFGPGGRFYRLRR